MHQTLQTRGLDLPDDAGIEQIFLTAMRRGPDRVALSYRHTSGRRGASGWQDVTYKQFHRDVEVAALQLLREGVGRGERVGVLGRNCYAWAVADFATLIIGAVTVPIYPTASAEQIGTSSTTPAWRSASARTACSAACWTSSGSAGCAGRYGRWMR